MPRTGKRLRQPLDLFSKHLSVELDQHSKIQINVNCKTAEEGREVSRKFVFLVSESALADMQLTVSGKFNSGANPPPLRKGFISFQEGDGTVEPAAAPAAATRSAASPVEPAAAGAAGPARGPR
jgi:hypothetical protein